MASLNLRTLGIIGAIIVSSILIIYFILESNIFKTSGTYNVTGTWSKWKLGDLDGNGACCQFKTKENGTNIGTLQYTRSCDGIDCKGESVKEEQCTTNFCPIHGNWSDWILDPKGCSEPCGSDGIILKGRTCTNPQPQFGGDNCIGPSLIKEPCNTHTTCPPVVDFTKKFNNKFIFLIYDFKTQKCIYVFNKRITNLLLNKKCEFQTTYSLLFSNYDSVNGSV